MIASAEESKLDYAHLGSQRRLMPATAVALVSLAPAALGSLLLYGRRRLRLVILLNGATLAAGIILFFTWPLLMKDSDYAGLMWLGICILVGFVGMCLSLKDRSALCATSTPQVAPTWLWMTLFWIAASAAGVGVVAAVGLVVMCFAFGRGDEPCGIIAAVVALLGFALIAAVISTIRWSIRGRSNRTSSETIPYAKTDAAGENDE